MANDLIVHDTFEGGLLGSKGMYRKSTKDEVGLKRLVNGIVNYDKSISARPLVRRNLELQPEEHSTVSWTRILPFTINGNPYALHYTPYHYLSVYLNKGGGTDARNDVFSTASSLPPWDFTSGGINNRTAVVNYTNTRVYDSTISQLSYEQYDTSGARLGRRGLTKLGIHVNRSTLLFNVFTIRKPDLTPLVRERRFLLRSVNAPKDTVFQGFPTKPTSNFNIEAARAICQFHEYYTGTPPTGFGGSVYGCLLYTSPSPRD